MHLSTQVKFVNNFTVFFMWVHTEILPEQDFRPLPSPTILFYRNQRLYLGFIKCCGKLCYCDTGIITSCCLFHVPVMYYTSHKNQAEVTTCPCISVRSLTPELRYTIQTTLYQRTQLPIYQQLLEELEKCNSEYGSTALLLVLY